MKQHRFLKEAGNLLNEMREIRRDLHKHPELGTQEVRTSRIVADYLENLGLEVRTGVGGHGVVAMLSARKAKKCVALRADMDALPVEEKSSAPYVSSRPGIAHCCGNDGHTAILLGTASLLCKFSDRLEGSVKFVFQPSEDLAPGGAMPMIADGALRNPDVDGIFSLHLNPDMSEGNVAVKSGFATISSAEFVLRMIGKGCHVASPHEGKSRQARHRNRIPAPDGPRGLGLRSQVVETPSNRLPLQGHPQGGRRPEAPGASRRRGGGSTLPGLART